MHECPECGQACYCHGDIDDCEVEDPVYSAEHCLHDCEPYDHDEFDDEMDDAAVQHDDLLREIERGE